MDASVQLRILRLRDDAVLPKYESAGAAGMDVSAALDASMVLGPGAWAAVPTGLAFEIPPGWEAQVRPRSGLAFRHAVTVLNAPGTIDADYRGEVKVLLVNHGTEPFVVEAGMRIAQIVLAPAPQLTVVEVESLSDLSDTERGAGGFGSTGTGRKPGSGPAST